jgi:hypothetical protein
MRSTRPWITPLCAAVGVATGLPALAGRPLQAEDAGVLEAHACELEGAALRLRQTGLPHATESGLQLACGVGSSSQLSLAVSRTRAAGVSANGVRLGGKVALWEGPAKSEFTLAGGISGARAAGGSWDHVGTDLNLVASVPVHYGSLHLNLGNEHDVQGRQGTTTWALAFEHADWKGLAPMAELFGDDRGAPWWNLGLRWEAVPDKAFLDLSYGRQMIGGRPALLTAGFKLQF